MVKPKKREKSLQEVLGQLEINNHELSSETQKEAVDYETLMKSELSIILVDECPALDDHWEKVTYTVFSNGLIAYSIYVNKNKHLNHVLDINNLNIYVEQEYDMNIGRCICNRTYCCNNNRELLETSLKTIIGLICFERVSYNKSMKDIRKRFTLSSIDDYKQEDQLNNIFYKQNNYKDPIQELCKSIDFKDALSILTPEAQKLLLLYLRGYSKVEISKILKIPRTTIEYRLKKTLEEIIKYL